MTESREDFKLSAQDLDDLVEVITELFRKETAARSVLRRVEFPRKHTPANFAADHRAWWGTVFARLEDGVIANPYRGVVDAALKQFPHNENLLAIKRAHEQRVGRVLVVGASPDGTDRIRADRELKQILAALAGSDVDVGVCPAAAVVDLQAVARHRPDVLHLACHSDGTSLLFEDRFGKSHLVAASQVIALLEAYRDRLGARLSCVVLNCCFGADIAQPFRAVADVVVAHNGELCDDCAVAFAGKLYASLDQTHSLADAAHIAAMELALEEDELCGRVHANLVVYSVEG